MTFVFLMYNVNKSDWSFNFQKLWNLTYTWLKSNLTKPRSGLTRENLREIMKYQRIWGNFCIVLKVE